MTSNLYSLIGFTAGLLSLIAFIPCLFFSYKQSVRPHRATWIIWTFLGYLIVGTYDAVGATHTLWIAMGNAIGCTLMMLASFRWGVGGTSKLDLFCFGAALISLCLWLVFDQPLAALVLTLTIDFIGAVPTYHKLYHHPRSESRLGWTLFVLSNILNLGAVNPWNFSVASYPVYLAFLSTSILLLTFRKPSGLNPLPHSPLP